MHSMLDYNTHAKNKSLYNTPPVFTIYVMRLVMKWLIEQGGLEAAERRNKEKAGLIYEVIDASGFYRGHAQTDCRSLMNVTFRLPSEDLEKQFVSEATKAGLDGLKGHRSVGGIRASIYNAFPKAGVEALVFTADSPYPGRRDRALRRGAQLPAGVALPGWAILHDPETMDGARKSVISPVAEGTSWIADLEAIRAISPLPVLVKGIMTAEDGVRACDHGAAGVIVSNHGGRHNDDAPATLDVLPRIVEAIGDRTEVLVDGGIRRGSDVVKALALGARAVLAGRAVIWGLASDGEAGSLRVLEILRSEIRSALAEVGCAATDALTRAHVASSTPGCAEMNLPRS